MLRLPNRQYARRQILQGLRRRARGSHHLPGLPCRIQERQILHVLRLQIRNRSRTCSSPHARAA